MPYSSAFLEGGCWIDVRQFHEREGGDEKEKIGDLGRVERIEEEEAEERVEDRLGFRVTSVERWEGGFWRCEVLEQGESIFCHMLPKGLVPEQGQGRS